MFTPFIVLRMPGNPINSQKYLINNNELGQLLGLFLSGKASLRRGKTSSYIYVGTLPSQENLLAATVRSIPNRCKPPESSTD